MSPRTNAPSNGQGYVLRLGQRHHIQTAGSKGYDEFGFALVRGGCSGVEATNQYRPRMTYKP